MAGLLEFLKGFFDRVVAALVENYGPAGPFYALAALSILMVLVAIPLVLRKKKDPLERFNFRDDRLKSELVNLRSDKDDGKLGALKNYLEPKEKKEMDELRTQLKRAGYTGGSAVRMYVLLRVGLGLGLLLFGVVVTFLIPEKPNVGVALIFSSLLGLAGFLFPTFWVKRRIGRRQEDIERAFPDAMDMILVCIEGGQSLDQAMARVGKEMQKSADALANELQIVTQEFRVGKDRIAVLRDFAERTAVNDVGSFVTVMIQSIAFGTSVADALRVYAAEMRDKRLMRAEEKANVLPTKLTLGTMLFTVPPLVLILVGPSFIQILRSFAQLSGVAQ
ncbi:type II secretion system F family protein [Limibaculum sp. M0105]|uniref:Type II secretion system F family protein n=1 Tax=Thermohalobaculum xanthum TaxID=2753746 RepID=A0A8J7MAZ6_9RHOB|nr:type II secretion system F family protein [Thermohalobaculum xanthum]MBK0400779.1 type II secretion system F family protein [Thermohalobaculum xanthum]